MIGRNWQEKIYFALGGLNGTDKKKLWMVPIQIRAEIAKNENKHIDEIVIELTTYILIMIKNGHVERAHKPKHIMVKRSNRPNYIYRLTSKPYVYQLRGTKIAAKNHQITQESIDLGWNLYLEYKQFPKWFRNMMK